MVGVTLIVFEDCAFSQRDSYIECRQDNDSIFILDVMGFSLEVLILK